MRARTSGSSGGANGKGTLFKITTSGTFTTLHAFTGSDGANPRAALLAKTLDQSIGQNLEDARLPSRKVNEIDNRGSTFYLALAWAKALAAQDEDAELKQRFARVAAALAENERKIAAELLAAQGKPVDIGGYYFPDDAKCATAMRPSVTLNTIIDQM